MRTLGDIIEDAKSGSMPTHEECYWAMLAVESLHSFAALRVLKMTAGEPVKEVVRREYGRSSWSMSKSALKADPKKWLGPNHDPSNPEVQRFRSMSLKLMDKALAGELPNQQEGEE